MKVTNPTDKDETYARKLVEERIAREHEHEQEQFRLEKEQEQFRLEKERADRYEQNLTSYIQTVGALKAEKVSHHFHLFSQTTEGKNFEWIESFQ